MGRIRPYGYQVQYMLIKRSFAIIPFSFFFWMNRLFNQQKYGKFIVTQFWPGTCHDHRKNNVFQECVVSSTRGCVYHNSKHRQVLKITTPSGEFRTNFVLL